MGRDNTAPFGRGETLFGGTIPADAATNLEYENVLGELKCFEDYVWNSKGIKTLRTAGRLVACRAVRNVSGKTLYPGRLVVLDPTNPNHVVGDAITTAAECYPVDEFLPPAGVANYDVFWIVVKGPAMVLLPLAGAEFGTTAIAAGDVLASGTFNAASTAAGSTADIGRIAGFSIVAATTIAQFTSLLNFAYNHVGRAMSAATSGQTSGVSILVDVNRESNGYP